MQIDIAGRPHLTYCTNIHAGETWPEIFQNIRRYVLQVKARVCPDSRYGIGLRLSATAALQLSEPPTLDAFRNFLCRHGLYVFTINGFSYGRFHGMPVKEHVYRPDWLEEDRLTYTNRLAEILAALLDDAPVAEGSISTLPGAFKPRIQSTRDTDRLAGLLLRHAAFLTAIHQRTGRLVSCALEPEPCCFLETISETVAFFKQYLFSGAAIARFTQITGLSKSGAEEALRRHVGVCVDACHAAVEFEDPDDLVSALRGAGIQISKIQVSTGLRVPSVNSASCLALEAYAEPVYLHQVVERLASELTRYADLPVALETERSSRARLRPAAPGSLPMQWESGDSDREWRIHFHVPVFLKECGQFQNTQPFLIRLLRIQAEHAPTRHLEVETYTWDVLPEQYRTTTVVEAISRELQWVHQVLTCAP